MPIILPLERLKVIQAVRASLSHGFDVVYLPAGSVLYSLAILVIVDPCVAGILPAHRWIHSWNYRSFVPNGCNSLCRKIVAAAICVSTSCHFHPSFLLTPNKKLTGEAGFMADPVQRLVRNEFVSAY